MSQSLRQNNLFVAEDWQVLYSAMTQINFTSYDYDTIRQALIDYIRINYPEDFNDWIESSEFIAIIEMLAYLASSLAFRIDLNVRENFLDTATRRDSVFRLARFLSYNARRCVASQGLIKMTSVKTNQTIYDSNGQNLSNLTIRWNDANNPDWFEQFVLVLNAAFQPSNPFGHPVKSGKVGDINADRYDFNNVISNNLSYPFSSTVNGDVMNFEFCNMDFTVAQSGSIAVGSSGYFREKMPNVFNPWSIVYRNDGNGNASAQTGFFMLFKQGTLSYTDYVLSTPVPNRVIDVDSINVNQNDVWVSTIDDTGVPLQEWTKVPAIFNSNLVYNSIDRLTRNIFQVVTRDSNGNDAISVRFGDGSFGNIPSGRIRVYYRTSNNLTYTVLPQDLSGINLSISYVSDNLNTQTLGMTFDLSYPVANSLARESSDSIRQRASAVYYTQNRMVNGEDYSVFPLQISQALKVKAVNRTYSGHSRFIDINDPTGAYQNTKVFSDDGVLWREDANTYLQVLSSQNLNTQEIVINQLQPLLNGTEGAGNSHVTLRDFYLSTFDAINPFPGHGLKWFQTALNPNNSSVGVFSSNTADVGIISLPVMNFGLTTGSWVQFSTGDWISIVNAGTSQLGLYGVAISGVIPSGTHVTKVIPAFRVTFTYEEQTMIQQALDFKQNFGLRYQRDKQVWRLVSQQNLALNAPFSWSNSGDTSNTNLDASWLIQFLYQEGSGWYITVRGMRFVFESEKDTLFYMAGDQKVVNDQTQTAAQDNVKVLAANLNSTGGILGKDVIWSIVGQQVYPDGFVEPRQVRISFWDGTNDNLIDNPGSWTQLVPTTSLVFWKRMQTGVGYTWSAFDIPSTDVFDNLISVPPFNSTTYVWSEARIIYVRNPGMFLSYSSTPAPYLKDVSTEYRARSGRKHLNYCWQHYANSETRIDPAVMNIVDIYVLTNNYDTSMRNWIARGRDTDPMPMSPTPEDLRTTFGALESYRMLTDQIVWHPVKYKLLFGAQAEEGMQAVFKVVKMANASVTDSEIKSRVIQSIDNFFGINNWNFGESFFFTELVAYIHQQNPTILSSVVIMPINSEARFGDLFEIRSAPDELFISCARVTDVQIVSNLNHSELRLQ